MWIDKELRHARIDIAAIYHDPRADNVEHSSGIVWKHSTCSVTLNLKKVQIHVDM